MSVETPRPESKATGARTSGRRRAHMLACWSVLVVLIAYQQYVVRHRSEATCCVVLPPEARTFRNSEAAVSGG
jgi:hypothetical protein